MNGKARLSNLIILAAVWSAHLMLVEYINKSINIYSAGVWVRLATLIVLTIILTLQGKIPSLLQKRPRVVLLLLVVGLFGFLLDAFAFAGLAKTNSNVGTVLLKTDVLISALLSAFVFKSTVRLRVYDWLLIVAMLAGAVLVMNVDIVHLRINTTDIYFILSALFVTLNAFLIKHIQEKYGVLQHVIAYYNNFFTLIFFVIFALVLKAPVHIEDILQPAVLPGVIILSGITQSLIYFLYYKCLHSYQVWFVKTVLLSMPIFSVLYNLLIYHTVPSEQFLLGAAIVIGSATCMIRRHRNDG
jgi:drug/metabolite transporter (DMT)-like permease